MWLLANRRECYVSFIGLFRVDNREPDSKVEWAPRRMTAAFRNARKSDYEVLGVKPTDDFATVRRAWRTLVRTYHPDAFEGDKAAANEFLARLNAAYDAVLRSTASTRESNAADNAYRDGARRKAQAARKAEAARRERRAAARRAEAERAAEAKRRAETKRKAEADRRAEEEHLTEALRRAAAERRAEALRRSETVRRANSPQRTKRIQPLSEADLRAARCAITSFETIRSIALASVGQSPAYRI